MKCLSLLLAAACVLLPAARAEPATSLKWGDLTVTVTPRPEGNYEAQARAVVRNGDRTVLTVTDWNVQAELHPLRPGGLPELVLSGYSGGAHCCTTYFIFTQDGGSVHNLAVVGGGNYGGRFVDLNRDGTQELLLGIDSLAYYDWPYAASPSLNTVLGWDGVRLSDRTRAYAYVPGQAAARELKAVQDGLAAGQGVDQLKPRLAGYYANMILAGRGVQAEQVLNTQVFTRSPALRDWFRQHRTNLINATYAQPEGRVRAVDSAAYPVKEPGQP